MKLSQIASALGARLDGKDAEISGVAGIEEAGAGQLSFVANRKYAAAGKSTRAAAINVGEEFPAVRVATLRCPNPHLSFARAIRITALRQAQHERF